MLYFVRAVLIFTLLGLNGDNAQAGVGKSRQYDASLGSKQDAILVGDLIRVTLDDALVAPGTFPIASVLEGDAVQFVALVKDTKSFVAYFVPLKKGTGKAQFTYTKKDGATSVLVIYDFSVTTPQLGRTLTVSTTDAGILDTATGKAPDGGVKVGDVIRMPVKAGITSVSAGVSGGDGVRVLSTVTEGGNLVIYFSADKPSANQNIVWSAGETGFISQPFQVFAN